MIAMSTADECGSQTKLSAADVSCAARAVTSHAADECGSQTKLSAADVSCAARAVTSHAATQSEPLGPSVDAKRQLTVVLMRVVRVRAAPLTSLKYCRPTAAAATAAVVVTT